MSVDPDFLASLARVRTAAGALITDPEGKVLIVEPTYKAHWEVPGGIIEKGEVPAAACARELREELGLELNGDAPLTITGGELRAFGFFGRDDLAQRLSPKLARRIGHALDARRDGVLIELENGARRT